MPGIPQLIKVSLSSRESPTMATQTEEVANGSPAAVMYILLNMIFLCLMSILFGFRTKNIRLKDVPAMGWIRLNIVLIYCFGISLIIATGILYAGVGIRTPRSCHSAIIICAVFYLGHKVLIYVFLIERAHIHAASYRTRFQDVYWILLMVMLMAGVTAIAIMALGWPIANIGQDGICRVGFPLHTTLTMLTWDICMNFAVTGVFLYTLFPFLTFPAIQSDPAQEGYCKDFVCRMFGKCRCRAQSRIAEKLQVLLRRTVIAALLIMLSTIANIIVLCVMKGHQRVWFCLLMCPLDVTWTVCVLHWLTVDPSERDCHNPNHWEKQEGTPNFSADRSPSDLAPFATESTSSSF